MTEMDTQNDRREQFKAYKNRDDLLVHLVPHGSTSRMADDAEDADLECFPGHSVLRGCSELGERWVKHCQRELQPDYMDEYEVADSEYPRVHLVRILDLALRCGLKVNMLGTAEHLDGWDNWVKRLVADSEQVQNIPSGSILVGNPRSFLWFNAFTRIRKPRGVPQRHGR